MTIKTPQFKFQVPLEVKCSGLGVAKPREQWKQFTFDKPLTMHPGDDGVSWQILDWETGRARHLHEMG